jgi:Glycosyl hydrolases family 16
VTIRQTRTGMRFELEFEDTFDGDDLETTHWLPYYLPHWSSRERSAARYVVRDGLLRLRIEEDQKPWCPELDGELRVSSLQTGELAGPVGSTVGQHRFSDAAVVREQQPTVRLYTPLYGRIELRARANDDPRAMVALWMIRYDEPEQSSEICICEIFGRELGEDDALVGVGVHPSDDERICDDFSKVRVEIDARDFHVYAVEWTPDDVTFFVDDTVIKTVDQSPDYPMQLLLNIYEFPGEPSGPYPKEFIVDYVRGYRLTTA